MTTAKALFTLALLGCAAIAAPLPARGATAIGLAIGAALALLAAAGLLTRALRATQRRQIDAVRALLRGDPADDPAPWFEELRAELGRRQREMQEVEAARAELGEQNVQAGARGGAALEMAREAQLTLQQVRETLEELRAALPQRALARGMERARVRAALDKVSEAIRAQLAALVANRAAMERRAAEAAEALGDARRLGEALQLVVINARLALESGRRDDQLEAAAALERLSEAASALLARVPDVPAPSQQPADVAGNAVAEIEHALAQALPAAPDAVDDDALLEQSLSALGRQFGHTLLQIQAAMRALGVAAATAAADDKRDRESADQA